MDLLYLSELSLLILRYSYPVFSDVSSWVPQISQVKDSLIMFPSTPSKKQPGHKSNQEAAVQQQSEVMRSFIYTNIYTFFIALSSLKWPSQMLGFVWYPNSNYWIITKQKKNLKSAGQLVFRSFKSFCCVYWCKASRDCKCHKGQSYLMVVIRLSKLSRSSLQFLQSHCGAFDCFLKLFPGLPVENMFKA